MSDSYRNPQQQEKRFDNSREVTRGGYRSNKGPGNKEFGGFRIRLSDNEMRSARSLQEAFNLRSTVAVLGFAIRTLAQMLEEGKLEELLAHHQNQVPNTGNRRENAGDYGSSTNVSRDNSDKRRNKPNPFARPEKPQSNPPSENKEVNDDELTSQGNSNEILPEELTTDSQSPQNEDESKTSSQPLES